MKSRGVTAIKAFQNVFFCSMYNKKKKRNEFNCTLIVRLEVVQPSVVELVDSLA